MSSRRGTTQKSKRGSAGNQATDANGAGSVDQIRQLIFGEQMTGYEERFNALEERLSNEIKELREKVERQLTELNAAMVTRTDDVEAKSVPRQQIAASLEKLAKTLRGG